MTIDDNLLKELGAVDTVVYTLIADNPHITQKELARSCKLSTRTVINVLQRLEDKHYIRIKNNKPKPNTYEILYSYRTKSPEESKGRGIFGMVKLSDNDYAMLLNDYPKSVVEDYIQRLDSYLKNNPQKNYTSHSATIVSWIVDDDAKRRNTKNYRSLSQIKEDEERANEYLSLLDNFSFRPPKIDET